MDSRAPWSFYFEKAYTWLRTWFVMGTLMSMDVKAAWTSATIVPPAGVETLWWWGINVFRFGFFVVTRRTAIASSIGSPAADATTVADVRAALDSVGISIPITDQVRSQVYTFSK